MSFSSGFVARIGCRLPGDARLRLAGILVALGAALAAPGGATAQTILVFGDSLSAAYGIGQREGWVTLLADRLKQEKFNYTVANASISGETTAGGASRIGKALDQHQPEVVVIALGSNDGLRGLPVEQMKGNLSAMVRAAQSRKARVVLVGNRMPPNYGPKYTEAFFNAFAEVARENKTGLVPFMLEPIAMKRELFQADQLHPTAAAQPMLLDQIWAELRKALRRG